ncbi:Endonuclease/exonuclease/phosphatase domain-containing protein [Camponotus japonicus]
MTRALQINLNHVRAAQDMMMQWTLEKEIEICAIQEPWSTANTDYWFESKNGLAAIFWNRGISKIPCRLIKEGQHIVAVTYNKFNLVSCYSSPNSTQDEYEEMLNEIKKLITKEKRNTIICGDFNAKSPLWSCRNENSRGKALIDLTNMLDLRLINEGSIATCVRPQGTSIVDYLVHCRHDS